VHHTCAGAPAIPPPRRRGAERFEDSDRWARGRILAALVAGDEPPAIEPQRYERALAGLERDGLIVRDPAPRLPGAIEPSPRAGVAR
jgi:A/G-specific adenine glycosylase